jgi:hypothetical protein
MMQRTRLNRVRLTASLALAALLAPSATAQAQVVRVSGTDTRHTINFNVGYFTLRGADSRDSEDALLGNLSDLARASDLENLEIGDFNRVTFGGEWLYGVSEYLEVGAGLGFYQRALETVYADLVDEDGTEIAQELKLRVIPVTATVRLLPLGRDSAVQPYVGGGIGIFNWRYSEIGEFVDDEGFIFDNRREPYVADGNAVGPVILGGVRALIGDAWSVGGEFRWQSAKGDGLLESGDFLGDKIDLGGWTTSFTFGFRF